MPSKELIEKVASHFEFPDKETTLITAENILNEILAAQDEHIEAEIDGYIENFRNMSRINGVHVTRALATLKRRLIDESPLAEQSE